MPRVMTICPATGHPVATHAVMTVAKFSNLKTDLAFYCAACRQPHLGERDGLWLETAVEPALEMAGRQTPPPTGLSAE
jgi:hypothetical protein